MISIIYTLDAVEGEPGPNVFWRGSPSDYLRLLVELHPLAMQDEVTIQLTGLDFVHAIGIASFCLSSSRNGDVLLLENERNLVMNLDCRIWREVMHKILAISFDESHAYVEFDDLDLVEAANIIISSEGESGR